MFEDFLANIAKARGRYPVANMVGDFLKAHPAGKPFRLGLWLQTLDVPTLEDIQTKLDMFLSTEGPDHAGEDLLIAVDLLSCAENGDPLELTSQDLKHRLVSWFEANMLEKLRRAGLAEVHGLASIDPSVRTNVTVNEQLLAQLSEGVTPTPTLPTTSEFLKS